MAHDCDTDKAASTPSAMMAPIADRIRSNLTTMTSINQIVARAAQTMAPRQSAVLSEAIADFSALVRSSVPNPADPTAASRAYSAYVLSMVQRGMHQLSFSVETIAEMNSSALTLASKRMASGEPAEPEPPPPRHTVRK